MSPNKFKKDDSDLQATLDAVIPHLTENGYTGIVEPRLLLTEIALILEVPDEFEALKIISRVRKKNLPLTVENVRAEKLIGDKYKKAYTKHDFYILFDFNDHVELTIGNVKIKSVPKEEYVILNDLINEQQKNNFKKVDISESIDRNEFQYLQFTVYHNRSESAFEEFHSAYSLFKGVLEFSYQAGNWSFSLGQSSKRYLAAFIHPEFVLLETGNIKELYMFDETFIGNRSVAKREKTKQGRFWELINQVCNCRNNNSIWYLLANCFRLYNLAISNPYPNQSFLLFWNLLEELTYSRDFNGKTDEILKRAKSFVNEGFVRKYSALLQSLINARNDFVHRGIDEFTDIHVGLIKFLSECGMIMLIKAEEKIDTKEKLQMFYELRFRNKRDQNTMLEVLTWLTKENKLGIDIIEK